MHYLIQGQNTEFIYLKNAFKVNDSGIDIENTNINISTIINDSISGTDITKVPVEFLSILDAAFGYDTAFLGGGIHLHDNAHSSDQIKSNVHFAITDLNTIANDIIHIQNKFGITDNSFENELINIKNSFGISDENVVME